MQLLCANNQFLIMIINPNTVQKHVSWSQNKDFKSCHVSLSVIYLLSCFIKCNNLYGKLVLYFNIFFYFIKKQYLYSYFSIYVFLIVEIQRNIPINNAKFLKYL